MTELRNTYQRAVRAAGGDRLGLVGILCPECGAHRVNGETWRVHRWLAHDVQETTVQ